MPVTVTGGAAEVGAARRRAGGRRSPAVQHKKLPLSVTSFLLPFVLLFLLVFAAPFCYTLVKSFFTVQGDGGLGLTAPVEQFAGLGNYARVLTSPVFWTGMGRVLLYGIIQVPVMLMFALVLALIIDAMSSRIKKYLQLGLFLPYAVPGVIAAIMWTFLYSPNLSPIVAALRNIGFTGDPYAPGNLLFLIANITTWSWTGYNMIIILSALQAVPREQYEAARLDGCNEWSLAWKIKVPNIRASIGLTVLMSIIGTVQLFSEPLILKTVTTNIDSQFTPMMMAYNAAFQAGDQGYSGAIAVCMALIASVLVFAYYRISQWMAR